MARKRLVNASQSGTVDPSMIWMLAQAFGAAKLDLGEELPAVVEHVIEQVGAANAGDNDPAAMLGFVADLVKQVDGDAFALFSCLNETSVGVPDESRAAMGMALRFPARLPPRRRPSAGYWTPRQSFGGPPRTPLGMLHVRARSRRPCCAA